MRIDIRLASAMRLPRMHAYCVIVTSTGTSHVLSYGNDGVHWVVTTISSVSQKLLRTDTGTKFSYIGHPNLEMSDAQIVSMIETFISRWDAESYDILLRNCWNFSLSLVSFFSLR